MDISSPIPFATALRAGLKGYSLESFRNDALAGLVVSLVALPLSMALSIAVGLPPRHGLYTAIVAGIVAALCGGSSTQVTGPTAEFASVLGRTFTQGTLKTPETLEKPHTEAIQAFHQCITRKKPSLVPWTQTLRVIKILEAVYASQEKGREVNLKG